MAKQSNNSVDGILAKGVIFVVIAVGIIWLVFSFATLIAPAVILILFLVNWIRYLAQDRKGRGTNFWLSDYEQELYEKTVYTLAQAEEERKNVRELVAANGISRNQDGQISQRSYAGKGLRERENAANSLIGKYTPIYNEIKSRPYRRWKKARSHYSNAFGFGLIILLLAAMFGISTLKNNDSAPSSNGAPIVSASVQETVDSTKVATQPEEEASELTEKAEQPEQTKEPVEGSSKDGDLSSFLNALLTLLGISLGVMAGVLGALAIIWLIGWLIGRTRFKLKNPEPPLVSMDNVATYIEAYMKARAKKEDERLQRKKERKQRQEQKRMAREQAKAEKNRIAEKRLEEAETQRNVEEGIPDGLAAEPETAAVPVENNVRQRSKEENMFISWADSLRNEGYSITGNWENWENSGPWKNLSVVSAINGVGVRVLVEYYVKSKRVYFGIAKLGVEGENPQELLDSETFQNIVRENGLTVKNNETWYCLKFSTFGKVFQEYRHLIETIS